MTSRPDLGPAPVLGYTDSALERSAELRSDAGKLAVLARSPEARGCVIGGDLIVLKKNPAGGLGALFTIGEARDFGGTEMVFLGLLGEAARFGFSIPQTAAETLKQRDDLVVTDLRSIAVQGLVPPDQLPPLAQAKAVLSWHATHRFCANCGTATDAVDGGWKRVCPNCKREHFPRTDPVAIMLAVQSERCLLGRSARFPPTMWSCLAGFVEPGESFEEAVRRETLEEAGIKCGRVTYLASQPWPFPMSLMIGCFAEAISSDVVVDRNELEDARWFTREECVAMLLRRHPQGLTCPPPVAIAHHILRSWIENGAAVLD